MTALALIGASAACGSDNVASIVYPGENDDGGASAGSDSGNGSASGSGSGGSSSSSSSSGGSSGGGFGDSGGSGGSGAGNADASSHDGSSDSGSGSSSGPSACNMAGHWLAVQHSVAVSDGFKEITRTYFYYDLSQNGSTVTVNHGLHCGLNVAKDPANLLGGGDSVSLPSATPALLARQDEGQPYGNLPARTGTMMMTSGGCQFHLNKYYIVRGATLAYYVTPSNTMSTSMPAAASCGASFSNCQTPGSEDWDNDGNPGITLSVSGTATGNIYAAQRDFSEYFGIVKPGATKFEVGVVDTSGNPAVGPEQYALGYSNGCSSICGLSAMVDTCPSSGCASEFFVDWVKLDSPPGSNNTDICSYVVNNAQSVAPRATDPNSVPTEPKYQ
jgi:hypothetical protein